MERCIAVRRQEERQANRPDNVPHRVPRGSVEEQVDQRGADEARQRQQNVQNVVPRRVTHTLNEDKRQVNAHHHGLVRAAIVRVRTVSMTPPRDYNHVQRRGVQESILEGKERSKRQEQEPTVRHIDALPRRFVQTETNVERLARMVQDAHHRADDNREDKVKVLAEVRNQYWNYVRKIGQHDGHVGVRLGEEGRQGSQDDCDRGDHSSPSERF